jgi:hypothetical protein
MLRFVSLYHNNHTQGNLMSRSFDYQTASVDATAVRLNSVQDQSYHKLITYYTKKEDLAMVAKLVQAKKLAKIFKLMKEYGEEYGSC